MTEVAFPKMIRSVAEAVIDNADHLTSLDQAIGDGDHGVNMKRGFEAVLADLPAISGKSLPEALRAVGTHLVMKVGGASGPLYGTLFLTLGKELPVAPSHIDVERAFAAALAALKSRGKSDVGQKTMIDVLEPVLLAFSDGGPDLAGRMADVARQAAEATIPMKAIRGRASFLGERSIGHMDPGACSAALMVGALAAAFEETSK